MKTLIRSLIIIILHFGISNAQDKPTLVINRGHVTEITSVCLSPDGKYAISGSADGTVKLWDISAGGKEIKNVSGHTYAIEETMFTPDGKNALAASYNMITIISGIGSNDTLRVLSGNFRSHNSFVCFTPDGNYALMRWHAVLNSIVNVFTGETKKVTLRHDNPVIFSPDSNIVLSERKNGKLTLWNISSDKVIKEFSAHRDRITCICFSKDGKYAVSGSEDKTVKLWNIPDEMLINTFSGHKDEVTSVSISPNGKYIISGTKDNKFILWDAWSGKKYYAFTDNNSVTAAAFSADTKFILSGRPDKSLSLWDISKKEFIKTIPQHVSGIKKIFLLPDGKQIVSIDNNNLIRRWNTSTNAVEKIPVSDTGKITNAVFSDDGKSLLLCRADKSMKLWDVSSGHLIQNFEGLLKPVYDAAISTDDGNYIITGDGDETINLWKVSSGELIRKFKGPKSWVTAVAFSPDGKFFLSGYTYGSSKIILWDIKTGKQIKKFIRKEDDYVSEEIIPDVVTSLVFSPDGKRFLSGNTDHTASLWDINTGMETRRLNSLFASISQVAFSPDGNYLLTAGKDGDIDLWDTLSRVKNDTLSGIKKDSTEVLNNNVNTGYDDDDDGGEEEESLGNYTMGRLIRTFSGHKGDITSAFFSSDGKFIFSSGTEGSIKIWDVNNRKEICSLINLDSSGWAAVTPGGYFDASAGAKELMYWVKGTEILPLEAYSDKFYVPGLLSKIMSGQNYK